SNDAVLIYYSGHGQTVDLPNGGEMGFLIPQDASIELEGPPDVAGYYQSCIPMQDIKTWRNLIPARHILFMADACYSGLLASDRSIPAPVLDALKLSVCQILTAGTRNQKAREEAHLGHGLFTAKILEALSSGVADLNKDGYIRASELGQFMRDINLENQTPQSRIMDGEGDFILVSQKRAEGDLSGVVIDQADKKPLAGAEVTLAGTEAGDRTNRKGEFKFKAPVGGYAGFSIRLPRLPKPVEVGIAVSVEAGEEEYVELAVPLPADYSTAENVTEEGWLEEEDPHGRKVRVWDSAETPPKRQNGCIWRYPLADSGETCDLVWIEPGKFQMGSPESEDGHQEDEQQHEVTLTRGFWMGRYEITNKQFGAFIDA
ncbi:MAG: SUMF1/EgtB/PvdO family nonheme iron enzyme, partial [Candidatus Omnitrophica bacterium]|nr:SUMF1/EgtB/PvdO family nonheme iron enzyme [Candidatus Omnitrophota bacterium]